MSSYVTTDPCTNLVLDFIAGGVPGNPMGESRGNYNAVFADIDAADDLGRYTLAEITGPVMDRVLRNGRNRSTATGRYQFLRRTLKSLAARRGLAGATLFTPELQDLLAVDLLVGRAYKAWWRTSISHAEFAHNISMEWASLPDPRNGGRSFYDGDGLNHASTSLAAVYDMLRRARAIKPAA